MRVRVIEVDERGRERSLTPGEPEPLPVWLRPRLWMLIALALVVFITFWLLYPFWRLSAQFAEQATVQPSRLYGRSEVLSVDGAFTVDTLASHLERLAYRNVEHDRELLPGEFRKGGSVLETQLRDFPTPEGRAGGEHVRAVFSRSAIAELFVDGEAANAAVLEPPLITSYYGDTLHEKRPVQIDHTPEHVLGAILAAEDANFYRHPGVSIRGIVRALIANVRGGEVQQGGSTITQQVVKNLFLTHDRRMGRKIQEAILATFVELRYTKREILEAYLNESYWGRSGKVNLVGLGAASHAFFGKAPQRLTVVEAATLAGVIPSPNKLSPLRHPEAAREVRDHVLNRMVRTGFLDEELLQAALDSPLITAPPASELNRARYAADAAAAEVADRFGISDLRQGGFQVLTTLSLEDQIAAEEALEWGLASLEEGFQNDKQEVLQGTIASVDPRDGRILAYVGGRNYRQSQFDRFRLAKRQAGSSFKPLVYAAAFAERTATPTSELEDTPIEVAYDGQTWQPQNDDGDFRGPVTVREALERSLNVPTVELSLSVGLDRIIEWARALGIESPLKKVPSIALGALEVTPREMLTAYSTLASGGKRPTLHLVEAVLDSEGRALEGRAIRRPEQTIEPGVAYLTTSLMEGVLDRGTARRARRDGLRDPVAGKTGTTNERRDNWFIGYAPDRATLVWVGYDESVPTRLSGSRAALPIWTRFMYRRRPPGGYSMFLPPEGVVSLTVDPMTGGLATSVCPNTVTEVYLEDNAPSDMCELHGRWMPRDRDRRDGWFRRLFRRDGERRRRPVGDRRRSTPGRS